MIAIIAPIYYWQRTCMKLRRNIKFAKQYFPVMTVQSKTLSKHRLERVKMYTLSINLV